MFTCGVDVGSLSANVVVLSDSEVIGSDTVRTGADGISASLRALNGALSKVRLIHGIELQLNDLSYVVATGYGRVMVPFSQAVVSEISCHARGNNWSCPKVRTILDMGGQDCKAIRCDGKGRVRNFLMNDKCAAGTGRYLERVATALNVPLGEFGAMSLKVVEGPAKIANICTVYAQRDIVLLQRR